MKWYSMAGVAMLCLGAIGCGKSYDVVAVSGKVSLAGGKNLPEGTQLVFSPTDGNDRGTATGIVSQDGSFELTHASGRKGAVEGKYLVELRPPKSADASFWKQVPASLGSGSVAAVSIAANQPLAIQLGAAAPAVEAAAEEGM